MGSEKKRLAVNLVFQISSFIINMLISFLLVPYVVAHLGAESYGFVGLANNFAGYIAIVTVALNGIVGRYIIIEIGKNDYEKANNYFSSVTMANIITSVALFIIALVFCIYLDSFIEIPVQRIFDVKLLFISIFASFFMSVFGGSFGISTYANNRLDLSSMCQTSSLILRAAILVALFAFLPPHVWYIGFATLISALFVIATNLRFMKKLLPRIKFSVKYTSWKTIRELISVGIWNSVNLLSQNLMTGIDLLIASILLNTTIMGLLSLAKVIPLYIMQFYQMVAGVFMPRMIMFFGKGQMDELLRYTRLAMRVTGFMSVVPSIGLIVFGSPFYRLWLTTLSDKDIAFVHVLSILSLFPYVISAFVTPLYNINTITLRLKVPVIVSLLLGIFSIATVVILLNTTDLGAYAIVGVSSTLVLLRILTFVPLYAAHNLKVKWHTFYPQILQALLCSGLLIGLFSLVLFLLPISNWPGLIVDALICGVLGYALSFFIIFNKSEMLFLRNALLGKLKKLPRG